MRVPLRIAVPILLAVLIAVSLFAFLWWQLSQSTALIEQTEFLPTFGSGNTENDEDVAIDPRDKALLHLRQGDLFVLRGEWRNAEKEYEEAVKANGGLPALRKLTQAQLQRRDLDAVRSTLRKLKSAGARPEDILLIESIIDLRSGELLKAKTELENSSDSPQREYGLALLAIIQGNHIEAQEHLKIVINGWEPVLRSYARTLQSAYDEFALFPDGSNLHLVTLLSRALAQTQECELALPLLMQVTTAMNDYRDAWIVQGYCELTTERAEQALVSLEQAYNLDPQKPEIQFFLARAYAALDQHDNAITFFEYALTNGFTPEEEIRRQIASEALEKNDPTLALEQYEALTQSEDATIETFEGFVTASLALGQSEEAYTKAVEATKKWPEDTRAFVLLKDVAKQTDREDDARNAMEAILRLDPSREDIKKELDDL